MEIATPRKNLFEKREITRLETEMNPFSYFQRVPEIKYLAYLLQSSVFVFCSKLNLRAKETIPTVYERCNEVGFKAAFSFFVQSKK
jgi:hypothetical protein